MFSIACFSEPIDFICFRRCCFKFDLKGIELGKHFPLNEIVKIVWNTSVEILKDAFKESAAKEEETHKTQKLEKQKQNETSIVFTLRSLQRLQSHNPLWLEIKRRLDKQKVERTKNKIELREISQLLFKSQNKLDNLKLKRITSFKQTFNFEQMHMLLKCFQFLSILFKLFKAPKDNGYYWRQNPCCSCFYKYIQSGH